MPTDTGLLRADTKGTPAGVDRTAGVAGMIRGYVVAKLGPFKSRGRGEFNEKSLETIVELGNQPNKGLKSRFTHPTESNDGLGNHLGRAERYRLDEDDGVPAVRADLTFAKASGKSPNGNLSGYIMDLAEEDPGALSSSLVGHFDRKYRLTEDGERETDASGEPLPPIWIPTDLRASDIVDTGDAVDGLLSLDVDEHSFAGKGAAIADKLFRDQSREVVCDKLTAWRDRYLNHRYGEKTMPTTTDEKKTGTQHDPAVVSAEAIAPLELREAKPDPEVAALRTEMAELRTMIREQNDEAAANKRAADISALCHQCGQDDKAAKWIEEKLSVDVCRARLLDMLAEERKTLAPDDTNPDGSGKADPDKKHREEYRANKDKILSANPDLTEDEYVEECKIDEAGGTLEYRTKATI